MSARTRLPRRSGCSRHGAARNGLDARHRFGGATIGFAHRPPPALDVPRAVGSAVVSPGRAERGAGLRVAGAASSPSHPAAQDQSGAAVGAPQALVVSAGTAPFGDLYPGEARMPPVLF